MQYRRQYEAGRREKLARRLLHETRKAQVMGTLQG
jgi:hypothetical protein